MYQRIPPRGLGSSGDWGGETDSPDWWNTAPVDPSTLYPAPGFNIAATTQAAPATPAQQEAARRYLSTAPLTGGACPPNSFFPIPGCGNSWFETNKTLVYAGLGVFALLTFLKATGGHR